MIFRKLYNAYRYFQGLVRGLMNWREVNEVARRSAECDSCAFTGEESLREVRYTDLCHEHAEQFMEAGAGVRAEYRSGDDGV